MGCTKKAENDQAAFDLFKMISKDTSDQEQLAEALFFMADMIYSDEVICKDYKLVASYAKAATSLGDSSATCLSGLLCLEGLGINKNCSEAIGLFDLVYTRDKTRLHLITWVECSKKA